MMGYIRDAHFFSNQPLGMYREEMYRAALTAERAWEARTPVLPLRSTPLGCPPSVGNGREDSENIKRIHVKKIALRVQKFFYDTANPLSRRNQRSNCPERVMRVLAVENEEMKLLYKELQELRCTGLSTMPPPPSRFRRTKVSLALAGGFATHSIYRVAAAATTVAAIATSPLVQPICELVEFFTYDHVWRHFIQDPVTRALDHLDQYDRAIDYANVPKRSSDAIAKQSSYLLYCFLVKTFPNFNPSSLWPPLPVATLSRQDDDAGPIFTFASVSSPSPVIPARITQPMTRLNPATDYFDAELAALLDDEELAAALLADRVFFEGRVAQGAPATGMANPPTRIAPVAPVTISKWAFPEVEANARAFNAVMRRVRETAEYRDQRLRPGLEVRIDALVAAMRVSSTLRANCFNISMDASASCGDRVALALNDMEMAKFDHDAQTGGVTDKQLFAAGEALFKLDAVNKLALAKIAELTAQGDRPDAVDMRLAYQVELADSLNLPGITRSMLFRRVVNLTSVDIESARTAVLEQLASDKSIEFIANWGPWRQAMERAHPADYERIRVFNEPSRDAISIQPPRMSENQWMQIFREQAAVEEAQKIGATKRLTRRFLNENNLT